MELISLLNHLESLIAEAYYLPFTNLAFVDQAKCLDLIAQIRDALPSELAEAQRICRARERILGQAEAEAEEMRQKGLQALADATSVQEAIRQAEERAQQITEESERQARKMATTALEYSSSVYIHLEQDISRLLEELRSRIPDHLASTSSTRAQEG